MARTGSRSHSSFKTAVAAVSQWARNFLEEWPKAGKGHDHEITFADEEEYLLDRVGDVQHLLFWGHGRGHGCVKGYGVDEGNRFRASFSTNST